MDAVGKKGGIPLEYQIAMVWTVIKRFLVGWAVAAVVLVIVSCVKYREFIAAAFTENVWAWVSAFMPLLIIVVGLGYLLKSMFR